MLRLYILVCFSCYHVYMSDKIFSVYYSQCIAVIRCNVHLFTSLIYSHEYHFVFNALQQFVKITDCASYEIFTVHFHTYQPYFLYVKNKKLFIIIRKKQLKFGINLVLFHWNIQSKTSQLATIFAILQLAVNSCVLFSFICLFFFVPSCGTHGTAMLAGLQGATIKRPPLCKMHYCCSCSELTPWAGVWGTQSPRS